MQAMLPPLMPSKSAHLQSDSIQTTLFDLIQAMQADIEPGEESLITDEISHLLQAGRITYRGNSESWTELVAGMTAWDQEERFGYPDDEFEPGEFQFESAQVSLS